MLRRYVGRNYPELLSEEERRRWKSFCASRILFPPIPDVSDLGEYRKRLDAWKKSGDLAAEKKPIIKALEQYGGLSGAGGSQRETAGCGFSDGIKRVTGNRDRAGSWACARIRRRTGLSRESVPAFSFSLAIMSSLMASSS